MSQDSDKPFYKRGDARAFAITVLIGILLFLLLSGSEGAGKNKIKPSPAPNPPAISNSVSQNFLANQTPISLFRNATLSPDGNKSAYSDEILLTNSGNSSILAGLIAIFPKGADESGASAVEISAGPNSNVTFLSPNPLAYASESNLHPGESGSLKIVSQNYPFSRPPAILLASPPLTAGETVMLGAFLESASRLELDFPASSAFSEMASEILFSPLPFERKIPLANVLATSFSTSTFLSSDADRKIAEKTLAKIASSGGPLSERIDDAALFASFLRRAAYYSQKTGNSASGIILKSESILLSPTLGLQEKFSSLDEAISPLEQKAGIAPGRSLLSSAGNGAGPSDANPSASGNNPPPTASGNTQSSGGNYANGLFPAIPPRMDFTVSEMQPRSEKELSLVSSVGLGYPVVGFTGESPQSFSSRATAAGLRENRFAIAADISQEAINDDGVVGFDSKNADLQLKYFSLPDKTGTVPLSAAVRHQSLQPALDYYGIDFGDSEPTVGEALAAINEARQCNPLGTLAYAGIKEYSTTSADANGLFCPVVGRITSGFGPRSKPCATCSGNHQGLDIAASEGTPVKAPVDGVVTQEFHDKYCGNGLKISHGSDSQGRSFATGYCHLSKIIARAGTQVKKGDVVGLAGSTGSATGPHLHWIVYINGKKNDPAPYYRPCTTAVAASSTPAVPAASSNSALQPPSSAPAAAPAPASASSPNAPAQSPPSAEASSQPPGQPQTLSTGLDQNGCVTKDFFYGQDISNTTAGSTSLRGFPSISQKTVESIIGHYGSPALLEPGFPQCVMSAGANAQMDPVFFLAWSLHETALGNTGVGTPEKAKNMGGLSKGIADAPGIATTLYYAPKHAYKKYSSYCDYAKDWFAYMNRMYVNKGQGTVEQIIPIYAPSSDGNDVDGYVKTIRAVVARWRLQEQNSKTA
ncbi:M23 family metallopeptidase [Candidatus Micrarchaeota archaeon]|nr:M23 family metallopeptidase [Candidatus Micrarchaeota archaeon]